MASTNVRFRGKADVRSMYRVCRLSCKVGYRPLWSDYCAHATHSPAMQRANLVARRIAQIGKIEPAPGVFTPAGRVLDALAAIGDAGVVESSHLFRVGAREADGAAIGVRRRLAVDRVGDAEHSGLGAIKDAAPRIGLARREPEGIQHGVVEFLRGGEIVGADHDV